MGDCASVLKKIPDESVDLIFTSPPYADRRKNVYGGVHPDRYVEWFLPIADELYRVLKKDGSFVLNIKERVVDGERHTYVIELILALKKRGWFWIEEYIWHKKNCYPGKWPNRFRDAWERLLHFTKSKRFKMFQDEVRQPIGEWAKHRLSKLGENDIVRLNSSTQSGFGKRIANWLGKEWVYPTNVLHLPTECSFKGHSAVFPVALPEWFIKLFTQKGDTVLDPFLGSGTTCVASLSLGRNCIGIDIKKEYLELAVERIRKEAHYMDKVEIYDFSKEEVGEQR